jgi:hypothetical protein
MNYFKIRFILILLFSFSFINIHSQPGGPGEIERIRSQVNEVRMSIESNKMDLEIKRIFINVLLIVVIIFSLIIISFSIYEIINCSKNKKELMAKQNILIRNSFNSSKLSNSNFQNNSRFQNNSNFSGNINFQISKNSFSSKSDNQVDSFHSSAVSDSVRSKEEKAYIVESNDNIISNSISNCNSNSNSNNNNNNSNKNHIELKESNNSRFRSNSGYEAPLVESVAQKNNDDEQYTNDGNNMIDKPNTKFLKNPY